LCFSGIVRLKMKRLQLGDAEAVIPSFRLPAPPAG
jgi:hypothetical protein